MRVSPAQDILNWTKKLAGSGHAVDVSKLSYFTGLSNTEIEQSVMRIAGYDDSPIKLSEDREQVILVVPE